MRMINKYILTITLLAISSLAMSQQELMFTHYMHNKSLVNAGATGSDNAISFMAFHRSQWATFQGAPTTQNLSFQMPLKTQNLGLGLDIFNDQLGPVKNLGINTNYAYHLKINDEAKLGLGLRLGINHYSNNLSRLKIVESNDVAFNEDIEGKISPNIGFGAFYYDKHYFLGISVPKFIRNGYDIKDSLGTRHTISRDEYHYYFMGGATIDLSKNGEYQLQPFLLIRMAEGAPVQADIASNFIYRKQLSTGLFYRTGDAIGLLLGYTFKDALTLGYSYDFSFRDATYRYNGGSHEVMLKYSIGYSRFYNRYQWIRARTF